MVLEAMAIPRILAVGRCHAESCMCYIFLLGNAGILMLGHSLGSLKVRVHLSFASLNLTLSVIHSMILQGTRCGMTYSRSFVVDNGF